MFATGVENGFFLAFSNGQNFLHIVYGHISVQQLKM